MKSIYIIEPFITFRLVNFYSIRLDEDSLSEADKFFQRFRQDATYHRDLMAISVFLKEMGTRRHAKDRLFRFEKDAHALPAKWIQNKLRLYCIRLSDEIVILGNGGIKTTRTAQDSEDLSMKFHTINRLARLINTQMRERALWADGKYLFGDLELFT